MAIDFEALVTKNTDDGKVDVTKLAAAISAAVGKEFVPKDRYNAKLEEIETLKSEKQAAEDENAKGKAFETKYNKLKDEYEAFKTDTEAKAKLSEVKAAYRKLLTDEGIAAKYIDTVMRATQFDGMKLDNEGKLEKADDLKTAIGKDWSDFKATVNTQGAHVETPPKTDNSGANSRAAELAKAYHERRYGTAPNGANNEQKG